MPFSPDRRVLRGSVVATIPDLEKVHPERNDMLLQEIADRTGGRYYYDFRGDGTVNWNMAADPETDGDRPVDNKTEHYNKTEHQGNLVDRNGGLGTVIGVVDQELFLPGSPDEPFARKLASWLILWLTLVLCGEWIIRRLHKLA